MKVTKNDIKETLRLLELIYIERMEELEKEYPNIYELPAEERWELDDYDCLLQNIDNLQATLEEKLTEME